MARYMIEASHDPTSADCLRILEACVSYGSHYLTHADWGCMDGTHTSWMIVEAEDIADARRMLPPAVRETARVVQLNKFTPEQIRELHRSFQQR